MYYLPLIFLQLVIAWLLGVAAMAASQALPDCENWCGNISIPYPFGTKEGCYIEESFLVTCDVSFSPPKLYLTNSAIEITDLFLSGQLRVSSWIARDCYNKQHLREFNNKPWMRFRKFPISHNRNKFIAVGCDTYAVITGSQGRDYTTGCLSLCDSIGSMINGSCSGIGCCQAIIPKEVRSFNISVNSYENHTNVWDFNPCSYGFVVEDNTYNFSSLDLQNFQNRTSVPVVLDWSIGNETCNTAEQNLTSFACKENSECSNFDNGPGYRCNCSEGYEGNPYLSNGCQDIDECKISSPCNMTCHNLLGTYNCSCPEGYEGDGRKDGSGCSRIPSKKLPLVNIALGISISISVLLLGGSWLYWGFRQRKIIKLREKFFEQNGGIMLQQQLLKRDGLFQSSKRHGSTVNEAKAEQLRGVANLAKRCLELKGDERPTMKEIGIELEGLRMMEKHSWVTDNKNSEETQYLLGDISDAYGGGGGGGGGSTSISAAYDSMTNHVMSPFEGGR
ncbi:hypothetical protein Acr_21g0004630 [Actinidia rufa]|uniref:EGF-like domain-containing protein n=1 Tax=Actinidia rufa TaxID=165716 RepID=A0A7J0GGH8_9ERIC|nr:hypothetical protein Acr_21g0004630 [Actinidia rufa]